MISWQLAGVSPKSGSTESVRAVRSFRLVLRNRSEVDEIGFVPVHLEGVFRRHRAVHKEKGSSDSGVAVFASLSSILKVSGK